MDRRVTLHEGKKVDNRTAKFDYTYRLTEPPSAGAPRPSGSRIDFASLSRDWFRASIEGRYSYNFEWLGRPIIQYPQDIQTVQELVWRTKPTLVIETGIAHGGSLVLSASMLALLDMCEAIAAGTVLDPAKSRRRVVGIDVDIRPNNRRALDGHPMRSRMHLIEGSSIDPDVIAQVRGIAAAHERVLVFLDSMHTHDHVLAELE
eukprot:gene34244-40056_t